MQKDQKQKSKQKILNQFKSNNRLKRKLKTLNSAQYAKQNQLKIAVFVNLYTTALKNAKEVTGQVTKKFAIRKCQKNRKMKL